ncbi:precorrin-6Y C5,15-methyltransferase (decarboxylating) [Arboricoccus pini]|uniref:Precorrin-6Y C5,15-methyltransferase (Decarboxylating) n=1 Tax=Arboricoccus pini TaxID=1963835 RepID=A0A212RNP8_9PROT|nr:precorrin-6y C5,15-methyltransferase (decarboxylating) subunit CbiE [Arboricoccus pini]SNB74115.1 precorrin-6Y C5,15-methyltransferase (decarboxylating) [Arboricoccus pini]
MSRPWLTIVGIGEDGLAGLSAVARAAIQAAPFIMGGRRHLALLGPHPAICHPWPSPLTAAIPTLLARRGEPTLVLASGDPFCWGIGATLARHVPAEEILSLPAPSAFSLAANRLGWPLQDCQCLSLHGRPLEAILPHLYPGARILALSWDGGTPGKLAALMDERGFGASRLTILESLGGPAERIRSCLAADFDVAAITDLNTLAVDVAAKQGARILPRAGLPDSVFAHDGQLTKRPIRAVTLSSLAPLPGGLLWDVGSGSGSVAIEWMLIHPSNRAIAIEADPARAARIGLNARELGVPGLQVVEGRAPEACAGLAPPDAIFVGGGSSDVRLLDAMLAALPAGGRLVVNAVTLEAQAELARRHGVLGGELIALSIATAAPIGRFQALRPALPVHQWIFIRSRESA